MSEARALRIADYDYPLPDGRIARYPLAERAGSKLLQYCAGSITDRQFADLPQLLPAGSLLIGNQTRVIHARLYFPLANGRIVEVFCLEPLEPEDYARSLGSTEAVTWKCLVGGNRRWKSGTIDLDFPAGTLTAERGDRIDNTFAVTFRWLSPTPLSFGEVLEAAGTIPLPPYLNRVAEGEDRDRYQTVFAQQEGSVAAPTAGLHFTPEILDALRRDGVKCRTLTLHVGAGTFKPVTSATLGNHVMHREYFSVPLGLLVAIRDQLLSGQPLVSIGTTSMRCLESLFYYGAHLLSGATNGEALDQWAATDPHLSGTDPAPAFTALIEALEASGQPAFSGHTQLLLTPAARVRVVDALITNFHQPRSTLLLLVAAMVGNDWRRIYAHALDHGYRFLSYGDSSLLWRRSAGAE